MQKNTLLFLVLSLAVMIAYPSFLKMMGLDTPVAEQPAATEATDTPINQSAAVDTTPQAAPAPAQLTTAPAAQAAPQAAVPAAQSQPARTVVVETDLYRAEFTTQGATVTQWELKEYFEDDHTTRVNLVNLPIGVPTTKPLALGVNGVAGFDSGIWTVNRESLNLSGDQTATLSFSRTDPVTGASVSKSFAFHGDSYVVDMDVTTNGIDADYTVSLGSNFGINEWGTVTIGFVGAANLVDGDVEREDPDDMEQPLVRTGDVTWAVSQNKYFLTGLIPKTPGTAVKTQSFGDKHVVTGLVMADGANSQFTLYAGPKEYYLLKALKVNLQENIDFGWFMFGTWSFVRILAEPMFILLTAINGYAGNFGVSIVLLTLLIKTVFIPLTHKSYKSMRAMQAIQPQIKTIQKKYKDNKEKLSRETMALYKEHQINPLGGCFPIFVQIPFFIAFFNILYTAIELRQTPFMGWIFDLSAKDPYYVLPIIMGISMFVQQKIQPSTMDPKQARLMLFLPVVFTFFFLNFPAGLVLYWLFNNLFTITQQFITIRFLTKKPA
jgi:YidC/Oxa1 family membrane protein insertase